jgi:hypothetical protein
MVFRGSALVTKDIVACVDEDVLESVQSVSPSAMPSPVFTLMLLGDSVNSLSLYRGIQHNVQSLPEFIRLIKRQSDYDLLR